MAETRKHVEDLRRDLRPLSQELRDLRHTLQQAGHDESHRVAGLEETIARLPNMSGWARQPSQPAHPRTSLKMTPDPIYFGGM